MEGLKLIPYIALVIAISGIILGATVVMQAEFRDTVSTCFNESYVYNSTGEGTDHCEATNSTAGYGSGPYTGNFSEEYIILENTIEGSSTIATQIPTIAIIAVMVIIISVIAGVFVYMKYFQ